MSQVSNTPLELFLIKGDEADMTTKSTTRSWFDPGIIQDIAETLWEMWMNSEDWVAALYQCSLWWLYCAYTGECPCFSDLHVEVLGHKEVSSLQLILKGSEKPICINIYGRRENDRANAVKYYTSRRELGIRKWDQCYMGFLYTTLTTFLKISNYFRKMYEGMVF